MGRAATDYVSTIGLDLGTSRVKAVRFDDQWRAVDTEAEVTALQRSADGRSEQDMLEVWAAAVRVLRRVVERSPDPVELVAITAQGDGCWLVDRSGQPVRPAILWNDNRGAPIIDRWERSGVLASTFRINGCYGASGLAHAQIHWLADHEPDSLAAASRLLSCGSWIFQQLTGRQVLDVSEAANPFLDATSRAYSDDLLEQFDLVGHRNLLPEVVSGPDRIAPLQSSAAVAIGLPAGTPVGLAAYDVPATAMGTGTVEVGQAFAVLGTTLCVGVVADNPMLDRVPNGMTLPGVTADRWLIAYATMTGTEVLDWTASLLALPDVPALLDLAATATPGEQPPVMLPYLSPAGERSPFRDSSVRGSMHGLTLGHGRADVARAAVDGLSLAVADCLRAVGPTQGVALSGGGARSALWCQVISNATGLPVTAPDTVEVGARGAVIGAAADLGGHGTSSELTSRVVRPGRTYSPEPNEVERLTAAYGRFTRARRSGESG